MDRFVCLLFYIYIFVLIICLFVILGAMYAPRNQRRNCRRCIYITVSFLKNIFKRPSKEISNEEDDDDFIELGGYTLDYEDENLDDISYEPTDESVEDIVSESSENTVNDTTEESTVDEPQVTLPSKVEPLSLIAVKYIIQLTNFNTQHEMDLSYGCAKCYPHLVFNVLTKTPLPSSDRYWELKAGQEIAISLGVKINTYCKVQVVFTPVNTDYLRFDSDSILLSEFVQTKSLLVVSAKVTKDTYLLKDRIIGSIKLI